MTPFVPSLGNTPDQVVSRWLFCLDQHGYDPSSELRNLALLTEQSNLQHIFCWMFHAKLFYIFASCIHYGCQTPSIMSKRLITPSFRSLLSVFAATLKHCESISSIWKPTCPQCISAVCSLSFFLPCFCYTKANTNCLKLNHSSSSGLFR